MEEVNTFGFYNAKRQAVTILRAILVSIHWTKLKLVQKIDENTVKPVLSGHSK